MSEWSQYAATDEELQPLTSLPAHLPDGQFAFDVPLVGSWEWTAYSQRRLRMAKFEYNRGGIIVDAPDAEVLRKAISIAQALNGRLIGDDDEVFDEAV